MLDVDCSATFAVSDMGPPVSPWAVEFSVWLTVTVVDTAVSAMCLGNKIEFNDGCIVSSGN